MGSYGRKLVGGLVVLLLGVLGSIALSAAPAASAQLDLCDLLGDPYCPDDDGPTPDVAAGTVTCTTDAVAGGTVTCTIEGLEVGDHVTVVLECGADYSAVVFEGEVTSLPFTFSFTVPGDVPTASGALRVNGATLAFDCVGSAAATTLARTGSDAGPLVGIAAALLVLGFAAVQVGRHRRQDQPA